MLCKCYWIVLYIVHFTAFCLGGPFFSGHGVCLLISVLSVFTTVVLVQNVKNLGGALVFIAYFIFLDHPSVHMLTL